MTIPARKARRIVVDDKEYRWTVSAPYSAETNSHRLNVTAESLDGTAKLLAHDECRTREYILDPTIAITPVHIAILIRHAQQRGWEPRKGSDFLMDRFLEVLGIESERPSP